MVPRGRSLQACWARIAGLRFDVAPRKHGSGLWPAVKALGILTVRGRGRGAGGSRARCRPKKTVFYQTPRAGYCGPGLLGAEPYRGKAGPAQLIAGNYCTPRYSSLHTTVSFFPFPGVVTNNGGLLTGVRNDGQTKTLTPCCT